MTVANENPHRAERETAGGTRRPQSPGRLGRCPCRNQSVKRTKLVLALVLVVAAAVAGFGSTAAVAAAARWRPPARITWYWQLQGRVNNAVNMNVYDIDGFDTRVSEVSRLHALGRRVVCYIDIGSWERWRPDAGRFPRSALGRGDGWPGSAGWTLSHVPATSARCLKLLSP